MKAFGQTSLGIIRVRFASIILVANIEALTLSGIGIHVDIVKFATYGKQQRLNKMAPVILYWVSCV